MRSLVAAAVASLLVVGASAASDANASIKRSTDIGPQALEPALKALARDRDFQLVYRSEVVGALATAGIKGELTAEEALDALLRDTGLTYRYLDDKTVTIVPIATSPSTAKPTADANGVSQAAAAAAIVGQVQKEQGFWSRFRVAQAESSPAASSPPTSTAGSSTSSAESSQESKGGLTEVLVTAQKREESLQDVPISISVLGGEALDRANVRDVTEALMLTPGLSVKATAGHPNATVFVRGVSTAIPITQGSSPTAYYVDSVPFATSRNAFVPDPDAYDLDRVEVLRGPQGTLYGATALNGVVRVLTKNANLNSFELKARGMTSSTEGSGWNYGGDMAVNVPLIEGKLGARATLSYHDWEGWIDRPHKSNANDAERRNARLKLNAQPTEQLAIELSAWLSRADYGNPSMAMDDGTNPFSADEPIRTDYDTYGLNLTYEFPGFTVISQTSYLKFDQSYDTLGPITNPTRLRFAANLAEIFAEELLLRSAEGGVWRWSVGGMYRDALDSLDQCFAPTTIQTAGCEGLLPGFTEYTSESYAIFGEVTRLFADGRFELTAGLRYFEDEVVQHEISAFGRNDIPPENLIHLSGTFSATTPRVVLTWHPTEQLTAYASYAQGFRSGVHQGNTTLRTAGNAVPVSAEPDRLTNYELGAKGRLLDGRLAFETALFYIDWQDVLTNRTLTRAEFPALPTPALPALLNGTSASGVGFEFGVMAAPVRGLELGANFSWNDLTWDGQTFSDGALLYDKGERLPQSVEYTVGGSAAYAFPLGGLEGRLSTSVNYVSGLPDTVILSAGQRLFFPDGDPITLAQANFSLSGPSGWAATLFVENLTNWDGATFKGAPPALLPYARGRVRPRTVGVQLEYHF